MNKRRILVLAMIVALVGGLVAAGCAAPAPAPPAPAPPAPAKVYEWNFFSPYTPLEAAICEELVILFDEVEEATGGQLKITEYWLGEHPFAGGDMLKVTKERQAELSHILGGYVSGVNRAFAIDSVPFLLPLDTFEAFEVIKGLYGGFKGDRSGVLERILQDDWNTTTLWFIPASPQRFFTKGYEVTGIGSLEGHKVRIWSPELGRAVEILGGTPVSISFGEVYTSLATGLVDGLITSLQPADSAGFLELCDTINLWELCVPMDGLLASRDALAELPVDVRDTLLDIMYESATAPPLRELQNNAILLEKYLKAGTNVYIPSQEAIDKAVELAEVEIWPEWAEEGGPDAEEALAQAKQIVGGL